MIINLDKPPKDENERILRAKIFERLDNLELTHRKIRGNSCSKCGGETIIIDLTPTTTECVKCQWVEEI